MATACCCPSLWCSYVYINGALVGGCDATKALIASGEFDKMVGGEWAWKRRWALRRSSAQHRTAAGDLLRGVLAQPGDRWR